ncbi:ScpA family protein [Sanguibacter sp. HDW7]|uniref:segregation and condensation protein A n=1 Tax=Sanguibacter sp. HDW7 TaxID=2714931 RepID=UPI001F0E0906|nr:ScpA family protein [Sanguibacter sp. HDW7]
MRASSSRAATPPERVTRGVGDVADVPVAGAADPAPADGAPADGAFHVRLDNFEGPFDLLLSLISKHRLDITEVALARVTDEFIAYIRAQDSAARDVEDAGGSVRGWDLSTASEFLVVAATLLDLKAARLLPSGEVEDAEDLELLEARDLLFARLLQYRAYKDVSRAFAERLVREGRSVPRSVGLEPEHAALLPELVWTLGPEGLALLAARALAPKAPPPGVDVSHLHGSIVSVRDQAAVLVERLQRAGTLSFRTLTQDAEGTLVVVVRFLALLELFRDGVVGLDQAGALGELTVRWLGGTDGPGADDVVAAMSIDEFDGVRDDDAPGASAAAAAEDITTTEEQR